MIIRKSLPSFLILSAYILIIFILCGFAIATDYKMKDLMLIEPPEKLIYVAAQDTELNLSGGKVRKFQDFGDGFYIEAALDAFDNDDYNGKYYHPDVNFTQEGTYLVNIAKSQWFSRKMYFQFTVQVVSPGEYKIETPATNELLFGKEVEPAYCENVTAYMTSPPDNIIYPVGYEGEIDLAGIVVRPIGRLFAGKHDIADLDYTLETDADFNTPGSYVVRVNFTDNRGRDLWFCFTVAVAERAEK